MNVSAEAPLSKCQELFEYLLSKADLISSVASGLNTLEQMMEERVLADGSCSIKVELGED